MVVDRWRWIFRFRSLPKVWIAKKIPGRYPFCFDSFLMIFAAIIGILFIRQRLTQKKSQNCPGMVKVICCQIVFGSVLRLVLIQLSVAFLPQEEQNLDLQEHGTLMLLLQPGQIKQWYPRKAVRHVRSLRTLMIMLILI